MTTLPTGVPPTPAAPPAAPVRPPDLGTPPCIGVDPGAKWTAAVLRVGDYAEHGWTMGPIDRRGVLDSAALDDVDDWYAIQRYMVKMLTGLDQLVDYATDRYGAVRVGVETPKVPVGYQPNSRLANRLPMGEWLLPKLFTAAVIGAYPASRLVLPDKLGRRPATEYPRELRGTRPPGWGPNEARRGERDHERAAYDIAGLAAVMP
ncbi:hypothetical protein D5S17_28925 [Pseudonocardiaceae bacterium YIM PH 21723]|nr:hypothetical protein D5S17_28925 [Pseudonocardiaceae bacterium YIM PH 21723]